MYGVNKSKSFHQLVLIYSTLLIASNLVYFGKSPSIGKHVVVTPSSFLPSLKTRTVFSTASPAMKAL